MFASYEKQFRVLAADTPALRERVFRLRYQVYCVENAYEDPATHPDGLERDAYDAHAAHSLMVDRFSGASVGAVRIVLPRPGALERSFPLQQVCPDRRFHDPALLPLARHVEVSRFCISKAYRQRHQVGQAKLGLIRAAIGMTVQHGLTHWCAVMEPWLLRLLRQLGIEFDPVGPLVDYHGRRQPCVVSLHAMLKRVREERPDVWMAITNKGSLWLDLCRLEGRSIALPAAAAAGAALLETGIAAASAAWMRPSSPAGFVATACTA